METFQHLLQDLKVKEQESDALRAKAVARAEEVETYHETILGVISDIEFPPLNSSCDSRTPLG